MGWHQGHGFALQAKAMAKILCHFSLLKVIPQKTKLNINYLNIFKLQMLILKVTNVSTEHKETDQNSIEALFWPEGARRRPA